ncbi:MAG: hypothetical protein IH587_06000, partial [Anaerolineae bacterium]|nr:hypothetical protein [Anaerolineae bacterium]
VAPSRDRYRFSLGVALSELAQKFGRNEFDPEGRWPFLIDDKGDRWGLFIDHVRPVIDDINVYAFVAVFPRLRFLRPLDFAFGWLLYDRALLQRLGKLIELCEQIETVVGELDAAFEVNQHVARVKNGAIYPDSSGDPKKVSRLIDEFEQLHSLWLEWLDLLSIK